MAEGFKSDIPPAINQTAKKYIRGMMKGKRRWSKLYGSRDKEVMHKTANKMAMGEMQKCHLHIVMCLDGIPMKKQSPKSNKGSSGWLKPQKRGNGKSSPEVAKVAASAKRVRRKEIC